MKKDPDINNQLFLQLRSVVEGRILRWIDKGKDRSALCCLVNEELAQWIGGNVADPWGRNIETVIEQGRPKYSAAILPKDDPYVIRARAGFISNWQNDYNYPIDYRHLRAGYATF